MLTGIAVEAFEPKSLGRCRMGRLADLSAASLQSFVIDHVEPGATVVTDAWQSYRGLAKRGYTHEPHSQRATHAAGGDAGQLQPAVHRVAALVKRWLLGTHQGVVQPRAWDHLQGGLATRMGPPVRQLWDRGWLRGFRSPERFSSRPTSLSSGGRAHDWECQLDLAPP